MISKFRPFWSLDIVKTETWLKTMAAKGYHFVQVNFRTSTFVFAIGDPKETTYRIGYDKTQAIALSQTMLADGWSKVFRYKNWYFAANQNPEELVKTFPARDGLFRRNRTITFILGGIALYCGFSTLMIVLISLFAAFRGVPVTIVPSPFWAITVVYWAAIIFTACCWIRFTRSNKLLYQQHWARGGEKVSAKPWDIVRWKFTWQYSPDRLESWLEEMELQGFNLQSVGKLGTNFYFTQGNSRRVKYCADYQNLTDQNYLAAHSEAGWQLMFSSFSSFMKWTLWAQEYKEGQPPPRMYSDNFHLLKHARKIAITHSLCFLPIILFYCLIMVENVSRMLRYGTESINWFTLVVFGILILEFGTFTVRTWLYYRRLKPSSANM